MYDVLIRCRNEKDWLPTVLDALSCQTIPPRTIIFVDNNSTDGSKEFASERGCLVVEYDRETFNYSYALNLGMTHARSPHVMLLSAHCVLHDADSAERLLEVATRYGAAGVFGRQIPTVNSSAIDTRDLLTVFGREEIIYREEPFFHNAFSLVSLEAWKQLPFDEGVNGIEDRIWARQQARANQLIVYTPSAAVYHEHGLNQGAGEARAKRVCAALSNLHEDDIFEWPYLD